MSDKNQICLDAKNITIKRVKLCLIQRLNEIITPLNEASENEEIFDCLHNLASDLRINFPSESNNIGENILKTAQKLEEILY